MGTTVDLSEPGQHQVPLEVFLEVAAPPEATDYASLRAMVAELCADRVERAIIDDLAAQYRDAGRFAHALRVVEGYLDNGCHRLCALVLAGAASVDIWVCDDDHPDPAWREPQPVLDVTVSLSGAPLSDDDVDVAVCAARSFPLDGGWVDGDCVSLCEDRLCVSLYADPSLADRVGAGVVARLARFGIASTLVSVEAAEWG